MTPTGSDLAHFFRTNLAQLDETIRELTDELQALREGLTLPGDSFPTRLDSARRTADEVRNKVTDIARKIGPEIPTWSDRVSLEAVIHDLLAAQVSHAQARNRLPARGRAAGRGTIRPQDPQDGREARWHQAESGSRSAARGQSGSARSVCRGRPTTLTGSPGRGLWNQQRSISCLNSCKQPTRVSQICCRKGRGGNPARVLRQRLPPQRVARSECSCLPFRRNRNPPSSTRPSDLTAATTTRSGIASGGGQMPPLLPAVDSGAHSLAGRGARRDQGHQSRISAFLRTGGGNADSRNNQHPVADSLPCGPAPSGNQLRDTPYRPRRPSSESGSESDARHGCERGSLRGTGSPARGQHRCPRRHSTPGGLMPTRS